MTAESKSRRAVLAIIGNGGAILPDVEDLSRAIGRLAIDHGFRLVTGGLGGVMAAASEGARSSPAWSEGSILGVLPSYDRSTANPWIDIVIPTGLQLGRNAVVVAMADVVIAVGGGAGTLSEIAFAWQLEKPVVALTGVGGWSKELAGKPIDHRSTSTIHAASTAEEAIAKALALAAAPRSEPGDIGTGWRRRSP